ncbi:MAG TPA: Rid family hydrolase [Vitreimonas sp.]|nr:Rid family hydrolase [Vitreimonas sp.]
MTPRHRISSGGPWEAAIGYSRAVVAGDRCWVSGTTDAGPDGRSRHPGDAAAQARSAWEIVRAALVEAGFDLRDVVRTRTYVVRRRDAGAVGAVHGELFADIRPATTTIVDAGLIEPTLLVEVEADAVRRRTG